MRLGTPGILSSFVQLVLRH